MAHVLLPCDLPNWSDIQRNLASLKSVKDADQLVQGMAKVYDMCCISLEPEELHLPKKDPEGSARFDELKKFIEDQPEGDRDRFFNETLPNLVSQALSLSITKPSGGFLYSLKREEEKFELDRTFVKSLLANAFFSTFPKRTAKTHPCLQNFSFCDFFHHLGRRSHQKKLKAFLRYFQRDDERRKAQVHFRRKVLSGQPSLPGWLCSDKPLVPLIVRQDSNIHCAEPDVCRAFPCSSLVGGDVLQAATSPESSLFFAFPELMCCLSFMEELESNEALFVHKVLPHGIHKSRQCLPQEVDICLMDSIALVSSSDQQFEDRSLLRELNKALATFGSSQIEGKDDDDALVDIGQRRQTPVGESSSSGHPSTASSRRTSGPKEDDLRNSSKIYSLNSSLDKTTESKKTCCLPMISKSGSSTDSRGDIFSKIISHKSNSGEFPKILTQPLDKRISHPHQNSTSSGHSSTKSLTTASESSVELPRITRPSITPRTGDDEYYTADEDSDECLGKSGRKGSRIRHGSSVTKEADMSALVRSTAGLVDEKPLRPLKSDDSTRHRGSCNSSIPWGSKESSRDMSSPHRSDSAGFVLGGTGSQEDIDDFDEDEENNEKGPPIHERLEDFRRRIRRRTRRHLSKKMRSSSRSSYSFGSSSSSDMEDISEEEDTDDSFQYHPQIIRASNSEPSLASLNDDSYPSLPPISMTSNTVVLTLSGRKVVVTSSNGQLKAYSYDGVNPNLPVPFKAKFRTRRARHPSEGCITDHLEDYLPERLLELGSERLNSLTDSDDERSSRPTTTSRLSSLSSFAQQTQSSINCDDEIVCRNRGGGPRSPMAVGPSRHGDPQMRALILWLAASMAGLPSLIFYTGHEFQLYELSTVYRKVLARHWTVGDLSCELLRFCRNRLSPRRNSCSSSLFEQLLCSGVSSLVSTPLSLRQHSLD